MATTVQLHYLITAGTAQYEQAVTKAAAKTRQFGTAQLKLGSNMGSIMSPLGSMAGRLGALSPAMGSAVGQIYTMAGAMGTLVDSSQKASMSLKLLTGAGLAGFGAAMLGSKIYESWTQANKALEETNKLLAKQVNYYDELQKRWASAALPSKVRDIDSEIAKARKEMEEWGEKAAAESAGRGGLISGMRRQMGFGDPYGESRTKAINRQAEIQKDINRLLRERSGILAEHETIRKKQAAGGKMPAWYTEDWIREEERKIREARAVAAPKYHEPKGYEAGILAEERAIAEAMRRGILDELAGLKGPAAGGQMYGEAMVGTSAYLSAGAFRENEAAKKMDTQIDLDKRRNELLAELRRVSGVLVD
ncbi:MAG TPA: hypothetical protein VMY35_08680 [Phycisphaerae bacterium]|nr:hypothetical protein [Phycisphaerae bacterium]